MDQRGKTNVGIYLVIYITRAWQLMTITLKYITFCPKLILKLFKLFNHVGLLTSYLTYTNVQILKESVTKKVYLTNNKGKQKVTIKTNTLRQQIQQNFTKQITME